MESKEIAIRKPEEIWTSEQINAIRNTVAQGADDSELQMFLALATKYDLDPFAKEIWFVQMKGRNSIITGRDGYLKIANRNPNFDGMESDIVCAGDKFYKEGSIIRHAYNSSNRGPIIGAYAVVYRKDRSHPAYFFAPFKEYNKNSSVWTQYPSAMIIKVAESMALKRAFSISGLVTEEEIGNGDNDVKPVQQQNTKQNIEQEERKTQIHQLWNRYLAVCDNQLNHAQNAMTKVTGKEHSADYNDEDIKALFADVIRREDEKMNAEIAEQHKLSQQNAIDVDEISTQQNNNEDSTN